MGTATHMVEKKGKCTPISTNNYSENNILKKRTVLTISRKAGKVIVKEATKAKPDKLKNAKSVKKVRNTDKLYFLLQVNDPTFPIGAYSHSFGLETYIDKGMVRSADATFEYIKVNLQGSFLYTELLSAMLAYDYATKGEFEKLKELDQILVAIKAPREIREASEKLGSRYVKTVKSMGIDFADTIFETYTENAEKENSIMNYSVAYGVSCAALEIDKEEALETFLYNNTSGLITNAVKSVPLSQSDGQKMLADLYPLFHDLVEKVQTLDESHLGISMPGFEIRSMQHEVIYTRLYMS